MRITYVRAGSHLLHGRSCRDALEVLDAMHVQVHCATAIAEVGIARLFARAWEAKRTALTRRRDATVAAAAVALWRARWRMEARRRFLTGCSPKVRSG